MGVGALGRDDDRGGVRRAHAGDVLGDGAGEELDVLRQIAHVPAQLVARPGGNVGAIEAHGAARRRPDADDQSRQGRLARRAGADDRERLARCEIAATRP